jgi:hypothetical protein
MMNGRAREVSKKVKKASFYFLTLFSILLGFLSGPFLLLCMILTYVIRGGPPFQLLIVVFFLITSGFYIFIGGLRFFKLIIGGKIIITDWYPPDEFLPKRDCKIIEKKKLRFLGLINAKEYYLVECTIYGYPLKMAVITRVSFIGHPSIIDFGNIHVIFKGNVDIFKCLELE